MEQREQMFKERFGAHAAAAAARKEVRSGWDSLGPSREHREHRGCRLQYCAAQATNVENSGPPPCGRRAACVL